MVPHKPQICYPTPPRRICSLTLFILRSYSFFWVTLPFWYLLSYILKYQVQFSCSVTSDSLQPHGLQHARLPCPSPTPEDGSNSGSFQTSQFFASGGQTVGASASSSDFPMNIQDWFSLGLTGWICLQSKGFSGVVSSTTVQKHQFLGAQLSL